MKSAEDVKFQLDKLLSFFESMHSLAAAHLGSFFTDNLWDLLPTGIQTELSNITSVCSFIQLYPNIIKGNCPSEFAENHPNLFNYIKTAMRVCVLNQDDFLCNAQDLFLTKNDVEEIQLSSPVMTEKKLHEVQIAARITALLSKYTRSSHVVDVGAGKGYLSSILTLNYGCNVLGLEISQEKTCSALKRSKIIAKNMKDCRRGGGKQYKQAVASVGADTNICSLVREYFDDVDGITITGLHTCGDLSSACIQMFLDNEEVKGMLNVGCCYNYLSEEFSDDGSEGGKKFGFPMSSYLKRRRCFLGRSVRMLAAHCLDRINAELGLTQTSLLYRAILETVLKKHNHTNLETSKKLPKRVTKCDNFQQYMQQALNHLDLKIQLTHEDIIKLYDAHKDRKPHLTAFFLLRVTLAPVVESIILLDRMLYLIENGISNAYLVRLFNLETSPRGFGVIAWKDS